MDDIQLILYIAFVLFAIVSRVLKSKKAADAKKPVQRKQSEAEPERQLTFEELLKEFTDPESKEVEKQFDYVPEPEKAFEINYQDDDEAERIYKESVAASKKYEEQLKYSDDKHTGNFKHFEGYSEEEMEDESNEFAEILNNQDSLKQAVILSEILNRKY